MKYESIQREAGAVGIYATEDVSVSYPDIKCSEFYIAIYLMI